MWMALALAPGMLPLLAAFQYRLLGQFYIGDAADSTRRAARRRERASLFIFFTLVCRKPGISKVAPRYRMS
jgi:hypothetical protein